MIKINNIVSLLICTDCRSDSIKLSSNLSTAICQNCGREYIFDENTIIMFPKHQGERRYDKRKIWVVDKAKAHKRFAGKAFLKVDSTVTSWHQGIIKHIPAVSAKKNCICFDLGCGDGQSKTLDQLGYLYIGFDIFKGKETYIVGDACFVLPIKNNSIDLITCVSVLEHLPEPWTTFKEVYRILKPGGLLIGESAFMAPYHGYSYFHCSHLGVLKLLDFSGFNANNIRLYPSSIHGLEYIARALFTFKFMGLPFRLLAVVSMLLRKILIKLIYYPRFENNKEKRDRINEFLSEEKFRFSHAITFVAKK